MADSNSTPTLSSTDTTSDIIHLNGFYAISWVITFLCTAMCAARIYIRLKCFRRLFLDDYFMLVAWMLLVCIAALGQVYLSGCYVLMAVSRGVATHIPADFVEFTADTLRGFGISMLMCYLGVWTIKLQYLLFFRRLGAQQKNYTRLWWVVLVLCVGCGGVFLGLFPYNCLFYSTDYIFAKCTTVPVVSRIYTFWKVSCIVDVISDVLIIIFPVIVLWKVRIPLRQKLALCAIFSIVSFTIAVTIVRGSIFGGTYKAIKDQKSVELNMTWLWFWFFIEFSVSLIIACLVSFRGLFIHNRNNQHDRAERLLKASPANPSPRGQTFGQRARRLHDSLLRTYKDTESIGDSLPLPENGDFSASFIDSIREKHDAEQSAKSSVTVTTDGSGSSRTQVEREGV